MLEAVFKTWIRLFPVFRHPNGGRFKSNRDGSRRSDRGAAHLRGFDERHAHRVIPIGRLLALHAARRSWRGREAFWADRGSALDAGAEYAVVKPPQCFYYLT